MKRFTMALFLLVFGAGMWGCGKEDLGKQEDGGDGIMAQMTSPEEEPDSAKAEGGEDRQGQVPTGSEERESLGSEVPAGSEDRKTPEGKAPAGSEDRKTPEDEVPAGSEERESPEGESREDQPSSAQAGISQEETGEHCFLGTIVEESSGHLVLEPDTEEEEREITNRVTVRFPSEHDDYLYGVGRRVVVYYEGAFPSGPDYEIVTEDISTEGFREFSLQVTASENKEKKLILSSEQIENFDTFSSGNKANLYYFGVSDVQVSVDNETISLKEALEKGKISLNAIIAQAKAGTDFLEELQYDDGGSAIFRYKDYSILKFHTLDGNRDVYFGSRDMDINTITP